MAQIADDVMEKIEARLNGTCDDLDAVAEEFGLDPADVLHAIGERGNIEKCTACSWWVEMDEVEESPAGEPVCADCANDE